MVKFNFQLLKEKFKKINFSKLFYNNKFVAIFSVLISFIIWVAVSSNTSESVPVVIGDIPVDIKLSESAVQDGLRIFSGNDITARVEITGNRLVVGQVTKNDIQVSASQSVSTITSPGNYTLELSAKKVGVLQDYEIVSAVKPSVITVMVDRYRESEFVVEPEINFTPKSGYFVGSVALSTDKVTLAGPETEISKVKKVKVLSNISGEVSNSINLNLPIVMYDAYGQPINSETITCSANNIDVSIPVLMKKEVNLVPTFSGLPNGINFEKEYKGMLKITPSKLEIAGPEDVISNLKNVKLEEIDFKNVNLQTNRFNSRINLPQGCRSLNDVYSVDVNINMTPFKEKTININQFTFKNIPEGKKPVVYNSSIDVVVLSAISEFNRIKPSDIVAEIDFANVGEYASSMEMPVNILIKGFGTAWVCGNYSVNVNLTS